MLPTAAGLLFGAAVACGTDAPLTTPVHYPRATSATALVPLDPFGIGQTGVGIVGCSAGGYRLFDFWVGKWDVYLPNGSLAGNSIIESELGGCAIEENWTSAFGNVGKSLNTYDAATGKWHQFWVNEGGCPFGTIFMEGAFANGSMTLQGTREQLLGFQIGPPCGPPPPIVVFKRTDLTRWTPLPSGSVLQQASSANDDSPLPIPPDPSTGLGLRYEAVAQVTPIALVPRGSFCPNRAAARHFDFMLGAWKVHQGNGSGAQGTATFVKTVTDCLFEERFAGPGGFEGMSYNTFDVFTQQWVRTWIDTNGERIHMTGGLVAGSMVFTGPKHGSAGHSVLVKITYDPVGADEVEQRWEYSTDEGNTWRAGTTIRYTRA